MLLTPTVFTRRVLVAFAMLGSFNAVLAAGDFCERMEYAQLKDSSRSELTNAYCSAIAKATLNQTLENLTHDFLLKNIGRGVDESAKLIEIKEYRAARLSCLNASSAASSMMAKKYKSDISKSCK